MKKIIVKFVSVIAIIALFVCCFTGCGNMDMFDTVYTFNYAYILLPNGECVEGKVDSWTDYADGDQLQITINGIIYLTDTTRAVLIQR